MAKKLISIVLTFCILVSCVAIGSFSTQAATSSSGVDYGLVDNIQYGNILHCWNWSANNIRRNLVKIAEQGFTAIQTSPLQLMKESIYESWSTVSASWWSMYQPIGFMVDDKGWGLATKDQLIALCNEAHALNIKVIVDVVFNHLANDYHLGTINPQVPDDIKNDSSCWHSPLDYTISDYSDRYQVTHYALTELPDLNTSSSKIQWYAASYLKELIYCGVDGFRFDAAKHIETPADGFGSEFWYNVLSEASSYASSTRGFTPFYYGEILDDIQGGGGIGGYTYYMSVTDNGWSKTIREGVLNTNSSAVAHSGPHNGASADKVVLWNESHDEFATSENWTRDIGDWNMRKVWAACGTKNQTPALFLARPNDWTSTKIGDADETGWTSVEVKAVNQFKNYFAGQSEYSANYDNFAYMMRGNSGCVIVDTGSGSNSWASVPTNGVLADGTYKDQISGNTFTVSGGWLYGQMGQSGISVIYNAGPQVSVWPATKAYRTDSIEVTLYYENAGKGFYSTDGWNYTQFNYGDKITLGANASVGDTTMLYVKSENMWGTQSNVETYAYWKQDPNQSQKLFFDKSKTDWGDVYAYVYDKESGNYATAWPGIKMSVDDNTDLMYCDIPNGFENAWVIFNDYGYHQAPVNGYGYKLNAETQIWYNDNALHSYYAPTTEGLSGTLYVKDTSGWSSDAKLMAYVWTGSSTGWAELTQYDGAVYKATLPSGTWKHLQVVRVDGSYTGTDYWSNCWNTSSSQMIPTGCNYFEMYEGWTGVSGSWGTYTDTGSTSTTASTAATTESTAATTESTSATTEATETTTEAIVTDYYLAGTFNNWSETDTPMVMSDGYASTTMALEAGTYEFKIIDNGNWYGYSSTISDVTSSSGVTMRSSADNATFTAEGGTYTFTYNTTSKKLVVTKETTTTEATEPVDTDYYLAGSFNDWSTTATPMTLSDDVATATVTLDNGSYEFKIVDCGTWYGYSTELSNTTNTSGVTMKTSDGNAVLNASGGTYTFSYYPSTKKLVIAYSSSGTDDNYNNGGSSDTTNPSNSEVIITDPTNPDDKTPCESHTFDDGEVTKKATYTEKGKKVFTCLECGSTKTVSIAKLKLAKPTVKVTAGAKSISVKYTRVKGATGFQVKYKIGGEVVTKTFKTKKSATKLIKNLAKGNYKVRVRAFVKANGKKAFSKWTKQTKVNVK